VPVPGTGTLPADAHRVPLPEAPQLPTAGKGSASDCDTEESSKMTGFGETFQFLSKHPLLERQVQPDSLLLQSSSLWRVMETAGHCARREASQQANSVSQPEGTHRRYGPSISPSLAAAPVLTPEVYLGSRFHTSLCSHKKQSATTCPNESRDAGSLPSTRTPTGAKPHSWATLERHSSSTSSDDNFLCTLILSVT